MENVSEATTSVGGSCLALDPPRLVLPQSHLPWVGEERIFLHPALSLCSSPFACGPQSSLPLETDPIRALPSALRQLLLVWLGSEPLDFCPLSQEH